MRCMCCNKPFTPARYIKDDGSVEFEKYCKACVYTPYTGYQYTEDHDYFHSYAQDYPYFSDNIDVEGISHDYLQI